MNLSLCQRTARSSRRVLLELTPLGWRGGLGRSPARGVPGSGGVHPPAEIRRRSGRARLSRGAARSGLGCACRRGPGRRRLRPLRLEASTLVRTHSGADADFHFLRDIVLHLPQQVVLARAPDDRAVAERPEGTIFGSGDVRVIHARRRSHHDWPGRRVFDVGRRPVGLDLDSPGKHRHGIRGQRGRRAVHLSGGRRSLDQHQCKEKWCGHASLRLRCGLDDARRPVGQLNSGQFGSGLSSPRCPPVAAAARRGARIIAGCVGSARCRAAKIASSPVGRAGETGIPGSASCGAPRATNIVRLREFLASLQPVTRFDEFQILLLLYDVTVEVAPGIEADKAVPPVPGALAAITEDIRRTESP